MSLKEARENFRSQLNEAEAESKNMRSLLREERELMEKTMREHSAAVADQLETQQRMEHSAQRREEALQRRLQQAEDEIEGLRNASVPEAQIKRMRDTLMVRYSSSWFTTSNAVQK